MKKLTLIILLILTTLSLQSCFFVAGAAAGAATVAVVYDHRKLENIVMDNNITHAAANKINANPHFKESHIEISCFNKIVLLTGQTSTPELRQEAEDIVHSIPKVNRIYNQIMIKAPTSSMTRASDTWITAKIKTQLLATKGMQSGTIKVVTENGTVYLMGIVSKEQADTAATIASQVSGVQRVMKIFQYK
ncbi:MAG: osmY 2 [Gammaproteobacteria bacterium]|jgi:osmotically-inducible protein OsmY|nr:osmY 2 [Gammaproteobacteria bacterium]